MVAKTTVRLEAEALTLAVVYGKAAVGARVYRRASEFERGQWGVITEVFPDLVKAPMFTFMFRPDGGRVELAIQAFEPVLLEISQDRHAWCDDETAQ